MKMDEQRVLTEEQLTEEELTEDQKTDDYVREKMMEAADAREAELNADRSLDFIHLTDAMREDMQRRIAKMNAAKRRAADAAEEGDVLPSAAVGPEVGAVPGVDTVPGMDAIPDADAAPSTGTAPDVLAMLSEEDRRALELGKKAMRLRRHRRVFRAAGIAAAIGLGVFGISMTSEANRLWWVHLWDHLVGKESYSFMDNAEERGRIDAQIWNICAEIKEKTGINAAFFSYVPKGLVFDDYMVREDMGTARMYYLYQGDAVLSVHMIKKKENSVTGQMKDGDILDRIFVETDYGKIEIRAQAGPDEERNYSAEFVYNDCQYDIHGLIPREEFVELIKNITIF